MHGKNYTRQQNYIPKEGFHMNNTAKKQNRILLITLVIVLTVIASLLALTGGANRRNKEENPPLDTTVTEPENSGKADEKAPETKAEDAMTKKDDADKSAIPEKDDKKSSDKADEENKSAENASSDDTADVAAMQSGILPKFSAPVDAPVLKDFSGEVPVFSYTMNDYRTHTGLDFACSPGTPVKAAADGTVCEITDDPMMGVTVALSHSGGAVTRYKGLSEDSMNLVSVGDTVSRGQVIGASGETALIESAEEDHLHFELEVNGEIENPAEFMKVSYLSDMVED